MKRLLIVTDAWHPQTNGVVTTLTSVIEHLPALGYETRVIHPGLFATVPLPSYPEIRVAREPWKLVRLLDAAAPDTVHLATEGPLGLAARRYLLRRGIPFTTSLHTKFPEYVNERVALPLAVGYRFLRWFHRPAERVLCTTESHRQELARWGMRNLVVWGRGVDTDRFRPAPREARARPRLLYVGRVAVEKNIEAFLDLDIDAEKRVVGDGPARTELARRHSDVRWLGYRHGDALVAEYAQADAFVFPSRTDTFGLVMLEAMACGTPVAGYPVTGPRDVVTEGVNGCLDDDLEAAVRRALVLDRRRCRAHALTLGWPQVAERLVAALHPLAPAAATDPSSLAA
ncbi:MAG: alpha-mannosyltransferase [Gammaproteobacteria bacterium]|nr:alpha-mannosyltransferase [Gammaproteobacteria bacterium]